MNRAAGPGPLLPFTPTLSDPEALRTTLLAERASIERLETAVREGLSGRSKSYPVLLGPSGSGKTHVLAELRRRLGERSDRGPTARVAWLHEEEWGIASYFDLLRRLVEAADARHEGEADDENEGRGNNNKGKGKGKGKNADEKDDEDQAEAELLEIAASNPTVWILERIDSLLEAIGEEGQRKLRALFQNHPRFVVVGSARHRPPAVRERGAPFFGFFDLRRLPPLDVEENRELAVRVARAEGDPARASALETPEGRAAVDAAHHAGGGHPRFTVVFAQALRDAAPRSVERALLRALDELTPLARARLRHLSPQQRRLVDRFVRHRHAVPVTRLAEDLRLTHQTTSGQLKKLRELGVVVAHPVGRESWYELADPTMRLALALKSVPGNEVRAWHAFLVAWLREASRRDGGRPGVTDEPSDLVARARAAARSLEGTRSGREPRDESRSARVIEEIVTGVIEPLETALHKLDRDDPRGPLGLPLEQRRLFLGAPGAPDVGSV